MRESKRKLIAIDVYSGCGGLTLGLKQAGFDVIGAIDNDPVAVETYRRNHPEVKVWQEDIRKLNASAVRGELRIRKGELDLLAGCPPCQGFSSIRTFNGKKTISDDRNDLVFDFLRFIEEFKPKAIMMENVPGLAKDHRMTRLRNKLKRLGYHVDCRVLDAADYEVPQRRRRMILLAGHTNPIGYAEPVISRRTVKDAIAKLLKPGKSGDPLHDLPEIRTKEVMDVIRKIPKDGGSRRNMGRKWQLKCHKKRSVGFKDVYGRMKWNDVSPTITGGCANPSKGRFLHPVQNRAITLREAALLQTFPIGYFFSLAGGKQGASLMIGNALPPSFIRHHAMKIREHLTQ
jgi:DNA (cytosine-5)-methyltransferase 1